MFRRALSWARVLALLLMMVPAASAFLNAQTPPPPADIRLVVDVSGSMAKTDPDNLRRPALSLLVRLLPQDTRAGVWTFGETVNTLVPHGQTDSDWKAGALQRVDQINSVALYTHIGAALEAAAFDREALAAENRRADIILLTDGMVDVSPDPAISAREQQRVVSTLVPRLRDAGYRIHTIGLSDDADEALLRQVARASDGMFSQARDADDLMDSFLQIFQQTVPANQLPINGGLFLIDKGVQEFTALIRRQPDQAATELIDPEGQSHRYPPESPAMNWHHTDEYDLITVTDPLPGRWELNANLEPFSRLTVISNLTLVVDPLANNVPVGEPLTVRFHLRDDNGVIDQPEVLELLTVDAEIRELDGDPVSQRRGPASPSEGGLFELTLPAPERPGDYELRLRLDGKTFQRLFTHRLAAASQFEVSFDKHRENGRVVWRLIVDGKETVNPEQTSLVAHVRRSTGDSSVEVLETQSPGIWGLDIEPEERAHYRISLKASGQTRGGTRFEEHLSSQYFSYPEGDDPQPDPVGEAIDTVKGELAEQRQATEAARRGEATEAPPSSTTLSSPPATEAVSPEPGAEAALPEKEPPAPRKKTHPAVLVGSLVLANGLLLVLAYFAYRLLVSERKPQVLEDEEPDTPQAPESSEPPLMQTIETEPEEESPAPADETLPESGDSFDLEEEDPLFPLPDEDPDDDEEEPRQ